MITYTYIARDTSSGQTIKSTVQADSERAAAKLLMAQGIVPTEIKVKGENSGLIGFITNRVGTKDKVIFTRQLATLINAGLPLSQSLRTVASQTPNKKLESIIQEIITSIEGGSTLADAFKKHPKVFNDVYISLISAGEASGTLDKSLERIANQQEKDAELFTKVRSAMVYPLIVLFVILGVVIFMLTTVVPQIEQLFDDLNQELPFVTQIMVGAADFVSGFWWLLIGIAIAAVYFGRRYVATGKGRMHFDTFKLNVPLFGVLLRKLYMARFTRTGETLLGAGVPMLEMLKIAGTSTNNVVIGAAIKRAAEKVGGGKSLSSALKNEESIETLVSQMINIGEQSGGIDKMMGKAADFYENEVDTAVRNLSTSIEPVLMVFLALVAGAMVAAVLLPVYGLINKGVIN